MNKAILWDLDGTLLYTLQDLTNATNATLSHFGYPQRSLEELRRFVGNGAANQIRLSLGCEPENFEEIMAWYRAYYPLHCTETTRPYEGIMEVSEALKTAGWKLAIVSNKPDNATQSLWRDFFPDFDLALGETKGIPRKPAPDMIFRVLDALQVQPENAVYVGDSEVDVATAKAAGLRYLAAAWGYRGADVLIRAGANELMASPRDILKALGEK